MAYDEVIFYFLGCCTIIQLDKVLEPTRLFGAETTAECKQTGAMTLFSHSEIQLVLLKVLSTVPSNWQQYSYHTKVF